MSYQINLLAPSFRHLHQAPGSTAGLVALLASASAAAILALTLNALGARSATRGGAADQALTALQTQVAARAAMPSGQLAQLARLRAVDLGQRRIRAALDPSAAGGAQAYSGYLLALSRQSSRGLWLTGFGVAADGRSLEISGRMTDPQQLPLYLHRLDAEPLFNGREFAQLNLETIEPGPATNKDAAAAPDYVEFTLRASASASESR